MNNFYLTEPCQMIPSSYTTVHTLLSPPKKQPKQVTGKTFFRACRDGNPKKARYYTAMLLRITIPTSLDIFPISPQHIAFPYMPHHPYSQPFEHHVLSHPFHDHTIINPLQQPALYTQHCSHHITIHTSSNKRLQLCTMQTTSISLMHTTD